MGLLEIIDVSKSFGGVLALDNICISINAGEILSLIGPNGAGKTTLINIITGYYNLDKGEIVFNSTDISNQKPHLIRKKGIARTFQKSELFTSMTVLENIMVGFHNEIKGNFLSVGTGLKRAREEEERKKEKAIEILNFIGMGGLCDQKASDLPLGLKKVLELGRTMAIMPKFLLLDEPVSGLNETEILVLEKIFRRIRDEFEVTILIVEHNMNFVMKISERIFVLDYGRKIAEGSPEEVKNNAVVIEAYLGKKK